MATFNNIFHSYDSMEDGEVGCGEEQQDDTEKKEDIDDGDMRDIDAEVRSSSPPAVWAKKAV